MKKIKETTGKKKGRKGIKILGAVLACSMLLCMCGDKEETDGKVKAPAAVTDLIGQNYEEVVEQFEENGFTNIVMEEHEMGFLDVLFASKENEVKSVSIDGDAGFKKNEAFEKDAEVIISYYVKEEVETEATEEETEKPVEKTESEETEPEVEQSTEEKGKPEKENIAGTQTQPVAPVTTPAPTTVAPPAPSTTAVPTASPTIPAPPVTMAPTTTAPKETIPTATTSAVSNNIVFESYQQVVTRNQEVSLTIKGAPNTEYDINVYYSSGASKANGLENRVSDAGGRVTWYWKIGGSTNNGTYRITVSGGGQSGEVQFSVVD